MNDPALFLRPIILALDGVALPTILKICLQIERKVAAGAAKIRRQLVSTALETWRMRVWQAKEVRRLAAVVTGQRTLRSFETWVEIANSWREQKGYAATDIQANWRGWRCRRVLASVRCIQAMVRGWLVRIELSSPPPLVRPPDGHARARLAMAMPLLLARDAASAGGAVRLCPQVVPVGSSISPVDLSLMFHSSSLTFDCLALAPSDGTIIGNLLAQPAASGKNNVVALLMYNGVCSHA